MAGGRWDPLGDLAAIQHEPVSKAEQARPKKVTIRATG